MKKLMISAVFLLAGLATQAQDLSDHAIGLRLGDNDGLGYEISYQHALSDVNRLQFDLGWRNKNDVDAYKLTGIYQWVWDLTSLAPGFNWFAGAGAGIGSVSASGNSETFINIDGNVGIEYNFEFPLQLSLDTRPELGIVNGSNGLDFEIALGARYKF